MGVWLNNFFCKICVWPVLAWKTWYRNFSCVYNLWILRKKIVASTIGWIIMKGTFLKKSIYCSLSFCQAGRINLPHRSAEISSSTSDDSIFKQIERWNLFVSTEIVKTKFIVSWWTFRFITILRTVTQRSFCNLVCELAITIWLMFFVRQICRVSWCAVGAGQCFFIPEELLMSAVQCAMHSPLSHHLVSVLFLILMWL